MFNLASNRARRGGPDEGLRTAIAAADVVADLSNQFAHAAEGSSPDAFVGNLGEEAFHKIQPGGTRGREVPVIAGVGCKPGLDRRMGVGGIVVENQMNRQAARRTTLDSLHKAQKLLMPMTRHAASQYLPAQHVQRGEQRRRAVAS